MNSLIDHLLGDTSCTVDGTQVSSNPLSMIASGLIDNTYQQPNISHQNQSNEGFYYRNQGQGNNLDVAGSTMYHQNSFSNSQFAQMSIGNNLSLTQQHQSQNHTNELEQMWSSGGGANNSSFSPYASFPFMTPQYNRQHSGSSSNAVALSQNTTTNSQQASENVAPVSVDDVLQASAQAGEISKEDLARIHRVIGYDSTATTETIQENMSDAPSKLGYTRAWEKLSTRLESLEDSRTTVQFTRGDMNPYLTTGPLLNAPDGLLALSRDLFVSGDVKNAILACEAEVQKSPDNSEGWHMLGTYYAENEDDKKALQCLKKAVEIDPFNIAAQLDLGTSYVNDLNTVGALTALQNWLKHNPNLQDIKPQMDAYSDGTVLDDVTQLMLSAAASNPNNAEVQTVLGILYNVSLDYTAAAEHFRRALEIKPNDYALLNKMGATLANNKRAVEATQYYAAALQERPSYTRGWVNLGIAFFNMGDDLLLKETVTEAAKCFVQALSLAPQLSHVWTYLRMALTNLNLLELVETSASEDQAAVEAIGRALGVEQILPS